MIIVGVTGEIASGKTTFADFLARSSKAADHWESWQVIAEVAQALRSYGQPYPKPQDLKAINAWLQPLPAILEQITQRKVDAKTVFITPEKLHRHPDHYDKLLLHLEQVEKNPTLETETITLETKEVFRPLLQWLGGFLVIHTDDGLWYDEILRRIAARPELELATIGGVRFPGESLRIQSAGGKVIRIVRPDHARRDAFDLTERQNSQIPVNATIVNDGSLEQLKTCAQTVFTDLKADQLSEEYAATTF